MSSCADSDFAAVTAADRLCQSDSKRFAVLQTQGRLSALSYGSYSPETMTASATICCSLSESVTLCNATANNVNVTLNEPQPVGVSNNKA